MFIRLWIAASFLLLPQLLPGAISSCPAADRPIRFAPLPTVSAELIADHFKPFVLYLSTISQRPVELLQYQNYQLLIEDFVNDQIDLAYLGPLPYVMIRRNMTDVAPLARFLDAEGKSNYTCSLVSFESEAVPGNISLDALISLPQPYSTCAYLMTENLLRKQGQSLEQLRYYYAGNHAEAVLDVIRGKATWAGVKTQIGHLYRHLGVRVFEQQDLLPGHLLVANPRTLSAEQIALLKGKILALNPLHDREDQRLTAAWGSEIRYGAIPVEPNDYRYVEQLLTEIKIPGVSE